MNKPLKCLASQSSFDRRSLLRNGFAATAAILMRRFALANPESSTLERVSITSVCFRQWIRATQKLTLPFSEDLSVSARELKLTDFPKMVREELNLPNADLWSLHFESRTTQYCESIAAAAAAANVRVRNIELDDDYDISNADETVRARSIAFVKEWLARARICGATTVRINTDLGVITPRGSAQYDISRIADSCRRLADYGAKEHVKVLIKNHFGFTARVKNVIDLVRMVDHPYCRSNADFGNMPQSSLDERIATVQSMIPTAALVTAKVKRFDERYRHINYDVGAIVRGVERVGYRGIYSIEQAPDDPPDDYNPPDPLRMSRAVLPMITKNLNT